MRRAEVLPEPVRRRLVERAADRLGALAPDDVPASLRRIARFEPRRRARLAGAQIAAALERDEAFRALVADALRAADPDLAAAVEAGETPVAVDPADVAAAAYLLRPSGWEDLVAGAGDLMERDARRRHDDGEVERLRARLAAVEEEKDREIVQLTAQVDALRAEVRRLRTRIHEERTRTRDAERTAEEARAGADKDREGARASVAAADAETRRLRARATELEGQLESARRAGRAERTDDTVRLAVLVDALVDAAQGLRRELALPSVSDRPADAVAARYAAAERVEVERTGEPGRLDRLLAAPQAHLVVDGYNVTKTYWPDLALADQRARLLGGLGIVAAQTRAEVTCVFDGADLGGRVPTQAPRGVRVVFSPAGVTADDVIAELVGAEPRGRRVVVVSSDAEVAASARQAGAVPVSADTLGQHLP
ncbi:MAG: RNA-binding protein [Streptosporangiales bacterium]|nr:RNA-binding protein [Streptosporangiales bacterium]